MKMRTKPTAFDKPSGHVNFLKNRKGIKREKNQPKVIGEDKWTMKEKNPQQQQNTRDYLRKFTSR